MVVLSLFDGMSCGQLALNRISIKYDKYYASEIDKHAIKVTMHHFPKTIQLGSVIDVNTNSLPKIDLLIGGSPCKGFSRAGKGLNFDHQESKLFFEYVRLWKDIQPKYWLLENVKMKKEWELEINKVFGKKPLRFDSGWVSAQVRERLYWTNIPVTSIPINKRLKLADILEEDSIPMVDKSYGIDSNYYKGGKKTLNPKNQSQRRNMVIQINPSIESNTCQPYQQNRIYDINGKSPSLLTQLSGNTHKIYQRPRGYNKGGVIDHGKSTTISSNSWQENNFVLINENIRKLTVKECCRLQTVPDDYFNGIVSDTQAYKMLGNGWTIDIIAHILSFMKFNN